MSTHDPIADMFTRIRNGQTAGKETVSMSSSKQRASIAHVLKEEGFITDYAVETDGNKKQLIIFLKTYQGHPVIERIKRVSKPSLRIYKGVSELSEVRGFGVYILSTSQGIMSSIQAKKLGLGGEVIGEVA